VAPNEHTDMKPLAGLVVVTAGLVPSACPEAPPRSVCRTAFSVDALPVDGRR
jgi:hypothetical protein